MLEGRAWTGLLLVAGGHIGLVPLAVWSVAGGCAVAATAIVVRRPREHEKALPRSPSAGRSATPDPGSRAGD